MSGKLCSYDLYQAMGSPVNVVAPMVDASELAWRMLARKYGAELCFTPMLHSGTTYALTEQCVCCPLLTKCFCSYCKLCGRSLHPRR